MPNYVYKYTRGQKVALSVLAFFMIAAVGFWLAVRLGWRPRHVDDRIVYPDSALVAQIEAFEADIADYQSRFRHDFDTTGYSRSYQQSLRFRFDPNAIDSAGFVSLGFRPWMARNLLRYRAKGGVIRSPHDLKRIYGIDTALVNSLMPYIFVDSVAAGIGRREGTDSLTTPIYAQKEYFPFDLNSADTATLARLPGIGPTRAARIVGYRKFIGGFHSVDQMREIENLPDSVVNALAPYATASADSIRRIAVNRAGVKQLRRHPYINYYQAKEIYDLRWDKAHQGTLTPADTAHLRQFTPAELSRLMPYLDFSTDK